MPANMMIYKSLDNKLKPYIKSIWCSEVELEKSHQPHQLLPMTHLDLVLIQQGSTKIILGGEKIQTSNAILQGLQTNVVEVLQERGVKVFGISFTPWGFYPFIQQSVYEVLNETEGYKDINLPFVKHLLQTIEETVTDDVHKNYKHIKARQNSEEDKNRVNQRLFNNIVQVCLSHLKVATTFEASIAILESFTETDVTSIADFCDQHHVHKRKLERDLKKYIGVTPREFLRIKHLVSATRQMINDKEKTLTDIGQKSEYYDQSHFIRHFKEVLHDTPRDFIKKDQALLSKIKTK